MGEGDEVTQGQVLACDPGNFRLPLIAPRCGVVSINTELKHMRAYEKMVSMWDGHGEVVTEPEDIVPAIKRAVANGKPSIINVEVDKVSPSPFIGGYAAMTKTDK